MPPDGRLPVTYDDFVRYGLHRDAIYPALQEVVALGFVEITEHGVAGGPEYRKATKFRSFRALAEAIDEAKRIVNTTR